MQCMVGANVYLTPCNSQGFAPHFDDVDAFICQISGRKRWRVYGKRADGNDVLPRASSIDFDRDDMKGCEVIIDTVLTPGDMLYLPRGAIHEAFCVKGETEEVLEGGSLHVTISMFQRWTWADFLLTTFERAVRTAALEDVALRRTLPVRFGEFFGVANVGKDPKMRKAFEKDLANMVASVGKEYPTDVAADMMMSKFMSTRIAPKKRKPRSVQSESFVRGVCEGVARIVMDDDGVPKLIHCIGNKPGEEAVNGVSCLPEEALAVDQILESGRGGLRVGDLQLEDEDSVTLVDGLVEMGIVEVVAQPEQNGTPLRKKRRR